MHMNHFDLEKRIRGTLSTLTKEGLKELKEVATGKRRKEIEKECAEKAKTERQYDTFYR